jgi:uncharacterized protein
VAAKHIKERRLKHRKIAALAVLALFAALVPVTTALAAGEGTTINEIRIDQPEADDDEYFELTGEPGASLDGLTYLVIGDGTAGSGVIEAVVDLTGQSLDSNGFFVAAEGTFTLGTADLTANLNFENSDNFTHLLVAAFSGANGADLDTDDDGTLDVTPWTEIVDRIALVEEENPPTGTEFHYGPPSVGPDGSFVPGHVYDCIEDGWTIGAFGGGDDTPGEVNICDAPPPPDPIALNISEVQGSGAASPHDGVLVTVEGVVVGDYQGDGENQLGGFNLQEEAADQDGDPATSEGIFVFAPFAPDVAIGDLVSVTGIVDEFGGMTEITDVTDVTVNGSAPDEVTAEELTLPVTDPSDFEPYEGMLVTFPQVLFISEFFNFDRFGEVVLTTERQYQGTHVAEPGEAANAVAAANALARITLDDTRTAQNPETVIHPDGQPFTLEHTFRGGDTLQGVSGTMHFERGLYRIHPAYFGEGPIDAPTYDNANPRPTSPEPIAGEVRVASFNVLNFFTHIDDGPDICGPTGNLDCRGADDQEEFERQLDKLVAGIRALDADIIGMQEIENDILDVGDDGDRAHNPVLTLVEALNDAEGSNVWAWAGEANHYNNYPVRNEIIYRIEAVEPVGDPIALADEAFDSTIPGNIEPLGRPPLAQAFRQIPGQASIQPFTVVVNHFKSKGSSCAAIGDPDNLDGQAHCNLTRVAQSEALLGFIAELSEESSGVLVIGDLNSYAKEDPIDTLKEGGLTELVARFEGPDAYSFVFDGQLGYLDTALATRSMLNWVKGLTTFHINADEPDILDYDTTFKSDYQDSVYEAKSYRVSDHDPLIIGLTFGGAKSK